MYSTYIYHARLKKPTFQQISQQPKQNWKKKVTICQKLHIVFFHLNLNPPKNVPLKRCQPHFTGSFSRLSTRPDTSQRSTLGHSGSRRRSQNFLEKKSGALFSEALGKVSLDIITRNQGWLLSLGGQYESMASQGFGYKIGVIGGDVRRIESRTWTWNGG